MPIPEKKKSYTYADILEMDEEFVELINGELYMMSPPPGRKHQDIHSDLMRQFTAYLFGKKCRVYSAPFGVRLFEEEKDKQWKANTFVEPDITVVCDLDKLDDAGCKGAPDLIIEILSPSNKSHDRLVKHKLYETAGVQEYWIVDPETRTVVVHNLEDGKYGSPTVYLSDATIHVGVLEDCNIDLNPVFEGI